MIVSLYNLILKRRNLMSLESKIDKLITSVDALTAAMSGPVANAPAPTAPVMPVDTPQAQAMPGPTPPMPAPPALTPAPTPAPTPTAAVPFNDGTTLVAYVMEAYQALGAEKGAQIQGVLGALGYSNINDVKPEHYASLFQGVEALKA